MVGMSTTPTKNGVSPNESMNVLDRADEDLREDRQQRRRGEQHDDRLRGRSTSARRGPSGSPCPPSVSDGFVNW